LQLILSLRAYIHLDTGAMNFRPGSRTTLSQYAHFLAVILKIESQRQPGSFLALTPDVIVLCFSPEPWEMLVPTSVFAVTARCHASGHDFTMPLQESQ
jgi:hypothetical protein